MFSFPNPVLQLVQDGVDFDCPAQIFLLKEESTGRYIDIRLYDLREMNLVPPNDSIESLATVFDKYSKINFPSLREQFDESFDRRYKEF